MSAVAWLAVAGWWCAVVMSGLWLIAGTASDTHRRQRDGVTRMLMETREALAAEREKSARTARGSGEPTPIHDALVMREHRDRLRGVSNVRDLFGEES